MQIICDACGNFHDLSAAALGMVITGFQDGDLQRIMKNGVVNLCIMKTFTADRLREAKRRYPNNVLKAAGAGIAVGPSITVSASDQD